jgi:hypothetical protein
MGHSKLLGPNPEGIGLALENCSGIEFPQGLTDKHGFKMRGNPAQSETSIPFTPRRTVSTNFRAAISCFTL